MVISWNPRNVRARRRPSPLPNPAQHTLCTDRDIEGQSGEILGQDYTVNQGQGSKH